MHSSTATILNRTLAIIARSYPRYLAYSQPYTPLGCEDILDTLDDIAEDQARLAERIAYTLSEAGFTPHFGEFPMHYTGSHDLGIEYQLQQAIEQQLGDIVQLEFLSEELSSAAQSRTLVDEALGMAIAHHELLTRAAGQLSDRPLFARV